MSFKNKSNQQVIDWVKAKPSEEVSKGMKDKIVEVLTATGFSGKELAPLSSEDDFRGMGFQWASNTFLTIIQNANMQDRENDTANIKARIREEQKADGNVGGHNLTKEFQVRYQYNGKQFTTRKKFTMKSKVSEIVIYICSNMIGNLDPDKTTLNYLTTKMTSKKHKTLADINFDSRVACIISGKVIGGMAALGNDEKSEYRERHPDWSNKHIKPTHDADDLLYVEDDNLRVKMPCGHNFSPHCIYQIIKMFVESKDAEKVTCPMAKCGKVWDFLILIAAADLNDAEVERFSDVFTHRAIKNSGDTRICKGCSNIIERPENLLYTRCRCTAKNCSLNSDFCWICGEEWQGGGFTVCGNKGCSMERVNDILQNCPAKVLEQNSAKYTEKCPIYRACPRCATLIEYEKECKHMKCFGCGKSFCFYCLGIKTEGWFGGGSWPCKDYGFQCKVAPRQTFK